MILRMIDTFSGIGGFSLAAQEGLSTRALEARLSQLQAALASQSVQLVLVAVERKTPQPRKRTRRTTVRVGVQLVLEVA